MIIIPIKWLFVWEYTLFSDKPTSQKPWQQLPFPAQPNSPRLVDVLGASNGQHGQVVRVVPVTAFQKDRDLGFHLMARWPLEVGKMEIGLDNVRFI